MLSKEDISGLKLDCMMERLWEMEDMEKERQKWVDKGRKW